MKAGTKAGPARRSPLGRPRKFADGALVNAALRVMEREGYAALTIRSLAQELGTSHSTLYNYVGHVEDIEAQALHKLTEQLPRPSARAPGALRAELMRYLFATLRLLTQHPAVLYPPLGSVSWTMLYEIGEQWVRALKRHTRDEKTARLALGALVASVVVQADRQRIYGASTARRRKLAARLPQGLNTVEQVLDGMMNLVLPSLARGSRPAR